jgi:hypothetical protein
VALRTCPSDGRRCSKDKCIAACPRNRSKFRHNKRKFLKCYDSSGRRVSCLNSVSAMHVGAGVFRDGFGVDERRSLAIG